MIPRNGKGPRSGEGFPCRSVAVKENLDRLGFAAAKLSIAVLRCGEGFPRHSVAVKENLDRLGFALTKLSIAVLRCGVATVHSMENCCVLFWFVIPLFQGHVYKTNEDPINVYKGPFKLKR